MQLYPLSLNSAAKSTKEKEKIKKLNKSILIKILLTITGAQPAYQGVSTFANSKREKYVVPAKPILKSVASGLKTGSVNEIKPLDLAFIGIALF